MKIEPTGNRNRLRVTAAVLLGAVLLAGCEENGGFNLFEPKPEAQAGTTGDAQPAKLVERDVEAPEVFSVTENGLWDGRPSLGGIWVAHPDVKEPERVIIRNTANSRSVVGALFRRERENPGPVLQVSSDAAEALGMLAGSPVELSVIALRREEAPEPTPEPTPEPAEGAATGDLGAPEEIEQTSLDPVAGAAVAIDAAESADGSGAAMNAGVAEAEVADTAAEEATRPPPEPTRRAAGLDMPVIQVGIFSLEENARSAATAMRQSGMLPTVRKQENGDEAFWRVLVGPSNSRAEQKVLLNKIKKAGFEDAYIVAN